MTIPVGDDSGVMSTFLELCRARRSVRRYAATPVPRAALERCLEAARLAPSACNSQPWTFIVVDEPERRQRLAEAAFAGVYGVNKFAIPAPVLVAVVRERSGVAATVGGMFRGLEYNLIDVGIACEHFILQAEEEGLGTCWLGWFDEKAVKRILGLDRRAKVDILISVGYPADAVEPRAVGAKRRKRLEDMSRFNPGL